LDSFNVDMELLRRIGEIRKAVEELDGADAPTLQALQEAVSRAVERTGEPLAELRKLLELVSWTVGAAQEGDLTPTSRLANGILAATSAAEQSLFSDGPTARRTLIDQAGGTLLLAAGLDPQGWEAWTPEADSSGPASETGDPAASETRATGATEPGMTLDDIASFVVQMDPEDRGETIQLKELLGEFVESTRLPDGFAPLHEEMMELLHSVTNPPRTRKAARQAAVERVGELLEEAALLFEEMEAAEAAGSVPEPTSMPAGAVEEPGQTEIGADHEGHTEEDPDGVVGGDIRLTEDSPSVEGEMEDRADDTFGMAESEPADPEPAEEVFPETEPIPEGVDPDLILDFVTEGFEYLEQAEEALLTLEEDPGDNEAVNVVFRAFHTIKGVSGFLELHRISNLAHHAESLLSKVRDQELRYTGVVADLSLRGIDVLKGLLDGARNGVSEGTIRLAADYGPLFNVLADPNLPEKIQAGAVPGMGGDAVMGSWDVDEDPPDGLEADADESASENAKRSKFSESSVRVRTDRLDRLVDMVGELVIAHSMLAQDPSILMDRGNLSRKVDHSAKILRELQDLSTSLRMVPLKPAFRKVTRVVRDLSKKVGKPVELITDGEDTEIDRTMVDILADPLIHMVRNSLDHGLESPEERSAAGKPAKGKLRISAFQAGGNVVIEVSDDGRGLNRDKILAKAIERGVVESDRGMTDREIFNLIFAPGFSTAEAITEVSGRGVGMDVVRRNVDSLRGRVAIDSEPGKGSTFSIHLPLTLAITDGMVIRVGTQRYIIPSVKIHMSLRPEAEALSTVSGKGEMVLIQGDLLPIVRLHRLWNIPDAIQDPKEGLLVIVGEGRDRSALLVDELVTQQQFVVKPLSGVVANTQGVAGGAIMGNGDVGLILDPDGIIAKARGSGHAAAA